MLLHEVGTSRSIVLQQPPVTKWQLDVKKLERFWNLKPGSLPPDIFVVESAPGEAFFHRLIMGRDRIEIAEQLIRTAILAMAEELRVFSGNFVQWVPLNGGLYFRAWQGLAEVFPEHRIMPLQTTFVPAGRKEVRPGVWQARVWDSRKGYFFGENLIVAEGAMASGSTGEAMVRFIAKKARQNQEALPVRVILFVAAGSYQGIMRTYAACRKYGIELVVILSQAIFDVTVEAGPSSGKTFTDLCLLNPGTIISEAYLERASVEWQGKQGCAVGDVGQSFVETREYTRLTFFELFASSALGLDPKRIDRKHSSVDVAAFLRACPFLLESLSSDLAVVRGQLNEVKKALVRHQVPTVY
ncbi:MAG: hypothetical protein V1716_02895 [Candidatus Uhrbacteria bacterium]